MRYVFLLHGDDPLGSYTNRITVVCVIFTVQCPALHNSVRDIPVRGSDFLARIKFWQ